MKNRIRPMIHKLISALSMIFFISFPKAQSLTVTLQEYVSGFTRPVALRHAGDHRMFVAEQDGVIRIIDSAGQVSPTPFLDISSIVGSVGNEQGLLGLAFHPQYAFNGFFYVNFTDNNGDTVVARYQVSENPDLASAQSQTILMQVDQPFSNHNGGDLAFGPDGYLYISLGDGGSAGDPQNYAQNPASLLGKILRIDVNGAVPYSMPPDNPFIGLSEFREEIWAWGLRNPWRISFDRQTGDLYLADVGQSQWEEIDFQAASSSGGENYGWRCYEGNHANDTTGCMPQNSYAAPAIEYDHNAGKCSITGGYVYRGGRYAAMTGYYIYSDYCSGDFWAARRMGGDVWEIVQLGRLLSFSSSFGEDIDGELYVLGHQDGVVYRVTETSSSSATPTPSPAPAETASPTPGATSTPVASPTSPSNPSSGVRLIMPSLFFRAGDTFFLDAQLTNATTMTMDAALFFVLEVAGVYYFWPGWAPYSASNELDYLLLSIDPGSQIMSAIPEIIWPETNASMDVSFTGALTKPDLSALIGFADRLEWGFE